MSMSLTRPEAFLARLLGKHPVSQPKSPEDAPIHMEGERDLALFDKIIELDIDIVAAHEDEIHEIMGILIDSFHGNMYFRSKTKSSDREDRLRKIAASGKVKLPKEFLYYADETSFSSDGFFKS